jgi:hypothetical protein
MQPRIDQSEDQAFAQAFENVGVLLNPTQPTNPTRRGDVDEPDRNYLNSGALDYLSHMIPVKATFTPNSINNIDDNEPFNLLEPLLWLIEAFTHQTEESES